MNDETQRLYGQSSHNNLICIISEIQCIHHLQLILVIIRPKRILNCLSCVYNCDDQSFIHCFFRSSNILNFHIFTFIYSLSEQNIMQIKFSKLIPKSVLTPGTKWNLCAKFGASNTDVHWMYTFAQCGKGRS